MNKKTVIVTGSSIGLGSSLIKEYAKNGYNVVINYVNHKEEALKLENEVKDKYKVDTLCIKCDITSDNDIENMFNQTIKKFKKIDILINNAGIAIDTTFEDKTKSNFMRILEVNLVGTFLVSRIFGDYMFKQKEGQIINISSNNGIDQYYEYSLDYDASKAGVINLTHNLANHYSPYVRVNCICPGWMNTDMNKNLDEDYIQNESKRILLNRFAEPEEIAKDIYNISTSTYINDSIIRIDGGVKHE
jgi:3-oxoacyl-[acyl-carrier protein] reductase